MHSLARKISTRARVEKPKPLKTAIQSRHSFTEKDFIHSNPETYNEPKTPDTPTHSGADDVFMMLEIVASNIQNKDYGNILPITTSLINRLRSYGSQLEESYEERLDKIFEVIRNGAHDMCIERQSRLNLLHLVELRASQWQMSPSSVAYYASKSGYQHEVGEMVGDLDGSSLQILGPGDVLKSSGKYSSPTRVPGKNYCKDEVVIRNSDSGKVNPGAKERLVQITGPTEDKIIYAKNLMEDTIKRNASPVRELIGLKEVGSNSSINSSTSDESNRHHASLGRVAFNSSGKDASEYKYSVHVQNEVIHISSTNLNLLNEAFSLLDSSYTIIEDPPISTSSPIHHGNVTPRSFEVPSVPTTPVAVPSTAQSPASKPQVTAAAPMSPAAAPMSPAAAPMTPVAAPMTPVIAPMSPAAAPMTPAAAPMTPVATPMSPAAAPMSPAPQPQAPAAAPMSPVAAPLSPTSTPQSPATGADGILKQYSREYLLKCSKSKAAQLPPADLTSIAASYPAILRQVAPRKKLELTSWRRPNALASA